MLNGYYDNQENWCRELYVDGELQSSTTYRVLEALGIGGRDETTTINKQMYPDWGYFSDVPRIAD